MVTYGVDTFDEYQERAANVIDVSAFINQCTVASSNGVVGSSELYARFSTWSKARGSLYVCSNKAFSQELTELGFRKKRSNGWKWIGIALRF